MLASNCHGASAGSFGDLVSPMCAVHPLHLMCARCLSFDCLWPAPKAGFRSPSLGALGSPFLGVGINNAATGIDDGWWRRCASIHACVMTYVLAIYASLPQRSGWVPAGAAAGHTLVCAHAWHGRLPCKACCLLACRKPLTASASWVCTMAGRTACQGGGAIHPLPPPRQTTSTEAHWS